MASLIWLLIPLIATCIAGLWSCRAARRQTNGAGDAAGVAGYDAFRSAMERSRHPRPFVRPEPRPTERRPAKQRPTTPDAREPRPAASLGGRPGSHSEADAVTASPACPAPPAPLEPVAALVRERRPRRGTRRRLALYVTGRARGGRRAAEPAPTAVLTDGTSDGPSRQAD
ncbi:hypothetical protein GL263_04320 [Streptomyces durbertensis]|uniref:Secreted protein n=1 Tax=Streptomyces durbertensis TaxID=2448886 RepID=A0ABR6EBU5_9ACTN|nr:hypothetical protein [Streptomyces durbertensis]MBB1242802.1 hypothetical protein [Streptomyces durbertensis]